MQFSTPSALAVIAIFAGQTLADCSAGRIHGVARPCTVGATGPNGFWKCPDGTKVQIADGDQYTVFPGTSMTYIRAVCQKDRHKISELQCTPGSPGALSLFCQDNQILIYVVLPPKA
ncbi:hypothetical protein E4U54_004347 [Claviceps lovelessii]|nr:hypothetical protein E4U54_004347 [Claviceps lovelessii]